MISGSVNGRFEIVMPVQVVDAHGHEQAIDAILDTGFTGSLTLSPSAVEMLGLSWRSRSSAILAGGQVQEFDVYAATVIWNGSPRQILVQALDNVPLLGMRLLEGYELYAEIKAGGRAAITSARLA